MQDSKRSELMEAIRRAVALFREASRRFLNKDVVDAVIAANGSLFDELGSQLAREKLFDLTRRVMKSAAEVTEADAQLELGLDIAGFEMPGMIAVPIDLDHPLNGDCEWVPTRKATSATTSCPATSAGIFRCWCWVMARVLDWCGRRGSPRRRRTAAPAARI